jgi:hypothetical protein
MKFTSKKKKLVVGISTGVMAASGIAVAVVANTGNQNNQNVTPAGDNELLVSFSTENGKVHLDKLISEPVGYANSNLQLEVHDAQGNVVKDATFATANLPEGIHISETGVLNGAAQQDGIFNAAITVSSPTLHTAKTLNVEVDVPKPLEVKTNSASFVDVVGFKGGSFSIAANDEDDKYEIISGVLPSGIIFDNDTGIFSGTPTESGLFHLTVRVTNENYEYSYSNIDVNLYVESVEEALTIGVDNIAQALENNVASFNNLVASLNGT